eukprot:gene7216-323_t
MAGWFKGIVKEVVSGDTLVIVAAVQNKNHAPTPEKRITLSSLMCPKLGKRDGSTKDEAFAWQAREFLRTRAIGQPVVFKIDYVVEQIGNREFGSVFVGQKDNLAISVVTAGWAKVRVTGSNSSPYIEELKKAEEAAQVSGLGVWTKDPVAQSKSIRNAAGDEDAVFNANAFIQAHGKGQKLNCLVEGVANGSTLRMTMLPSMSSAVVHLAGAQCPAMGRRVEPTSAAPAAAAPVTPVIADLGPAVGTPSVVATPAPTGGPSLLSIAGNSNAEPFSREAKHFSEMHALNREVTLVIEGVDKFNNLFGTVNVPLADGTSESLAELLIKEGLAKAVEWSLNVMTVGANKIRELERAAKQAKVGQWLNFVAAPTNQTKLSDQYVGKVIEIVSGDCLVVKDSVTRAERRVTLSSLRAPRMGTRDRPGENWATEAKDFLRKKLIGREVEVKMEYTRKIPSTQGAGGDFEMAFGNVETLPEKGEEAANVSEMIVSRGFATVVKHRAEEERSCVYERLVECEEMAKGAKRGLHSPKEPPANRINDVSQPGNATKAKQYLPFFQRSGTMPCVVEYVLSGHRLKLHIPKEGVTIVFAPSGIKTPSRAQAAGMGRPATQAEPYADEAVAFTREHCMQHDAEVTVESMDRGGTFLGTIVVKSATPGGKPFHLSSSLLRNGLGRLQPGMDSSWLQEGSMLEEMQSQARQAKLKIWEDWSADQDVVDSDQGAGPSTGASEEVLEVIVTEVVDANEFYVQMVKEPRVAWIAEQLRAVAEADAPAIPPELRNGQLCLAQFSADKQWYRAHIERVNMKEPLYDIYFIDFGNREKVNSKNTRIIDSALSAVPPQARMCNLAHVKVPEAGSEQSAEAKYLLGQIVGAGQPLLAHVSGREKFGVKDKHPKYAAGKMTITLIDPQNDVNVAVEMLCAGMARLPTMRKITNPAAREAVQKMQEYEEEARQARRGLFVYGDPGDSDDDVPAQPAAWGRK